MSGFERCPSVCVLTRIVTGIGLTNLMPGLFGVLAVPIVIRSYRNFAIAYGCG